MPKADLRYYVKLERTLLHSVENLKAFRTNYRDDRDRSSLEMRIKKLDEIYEKYLDVRMRIEVLTDDIEEESETFEESVETEEQREKENVKVIQDFENSYFELKQSLTALMQPAGGSAVVNAPQIAPARPSTASEYQSRMKLPELKLPSFSGKLREWITFKDTFTSMIHDNDHLSTIDKFTYLRTSLTGDALREIASIELTAVNYTIAWSTLQSCFENKKLIIISYLDALFAVKPMEKESYEQLNRVVGEFETNLMMLQKIGEETDGMSTVLQHMVCQRLDPNTLRNWENKHNSTEVPSYKELIKYLKEQCMVLRNITAGRPREGESRRQSRPTALSHTGVQQSLTCPFCGDQAHSAFKCTRFMKLKTADRVEEVKRRSLCLNCLSPGHISRFCSKGACHTCGRNHHTLLHAGAPASSQFKPGNPQAPQSDKRNQGPNPLPPQIQSKPQVQIQPAPTQQSQTPHMKQFQSHTQVTSASASQSHALSTTDFPSNSLSHNTVPTDTTTLSHTVLLSTALVSIIDCYGGTTIARALLDSGSQLCFMTEKLSQKLNFKRRREYLPVKGIGHAGTCSTQSVSAWVRSRTSKYCMPLQFYILPKVTADLPVKCIDISRWNLPNGIVLADPEFHKPCAIDIILGAEVFYDLLMAGQHKLADGGPTLQNTCLGWIVSGRATEGIKTKSTVAVPSCTEEAIDDLLTRFWELESCRTSSTLSLEESMCEKIFEETTTRDSAGRFIVTLPKQKHVIERLGESRNIALRRFLSLERRLIGNPTLKSAYCAFIHEYLKLQHMREVTIEVKDIESRPFPYYLPHHAVIRPDSTTTKLRVVFDASCATSSGVSLNEALMVGPVVQEDLLSIVIRFRLHKLAIVADIAKMYRMINVDSADHHLQRILWRDSAREPIRTFELTTVTYGTSSAPYLATRCLQRLADDGKQQHPTAARILSKDFYVDDMLSGVDSVEEGVSLYTTMNQLLASAGFILRKWSSNSSEILAEIPDTLKDDRTSLELDSSKATIKTLGLVWEPRSDQFRFTVPQWNDSTEINKRIILSDFARLFDPLGLVGPVVVQAKIFLQDLWKQKCSWIEPLSEELQQWWLEFRSNLAGLKNLTVPRWVAFGKDIVTAELHGFCDASEKAYGACIYLRCTTRNGHVSISLIAAKSRVAPLDDVQRKKKKMTIPRLELSSALVLSYLYEKVDNSLGITAEPFFYTDSTVVKCWLSSTPSRWQIFVGNRTSTIQHLTRKGVWYHIAGTENPADIISRGMTPQLLAEHRVWWHGPDWLQLPKSSWPTSVHIDDTNLDQSLLEEKIIVAAPVHPDPPSDFFKLRSTLTALVRVATLCRRFVYNCRNRDNPRINFLSFPEREEALLGLVKLAQCESFAEDITEVALKGDVKSTSRLKTLHPVLVNGVLVVGGRLENALVSPSRKHPMIMDNRHPFTFLIVKHYHINLLHAGQQLIIASVRERFWPLRLKSLARKVTHSCVACFRAKPKVEEQLMADLPAERVCPAPPFLRVGVDYCGPFKIRFPHRKTDVRICYVAIFICLVTKAVHFEMVSDQKTAGFIAALRRMVSRRGRPEIVMCDNAKYFIGAKRELDELHRLFNSQEFKQSVAQEAANEGINFKFIPPRSPNFGGLWEAAVKSMKYHLKRTLGASIATTDEFHTLSTQIEACLNSRPLTPLSNDPMDLEILTPGHFLVHRPLTAIPEPSLQHLQENTLSRWQRVQKYLQVIWKKWSTSYLSDLQNRTKWTRQHKNLAKGMMVLLKDDCQPPLRWLLGRIVEVHAGNDGNVRVVKVMTKNGPFTRCISKICVLPIQDNESPPEAN